MKKKLPTRSGERGTYFHGVLRKEFFLLKRRFAPSCCPNFAIFKKCLPHVETDSVKVWRDFRDFSSRTARPTEMDTWRIS